MFCVLFCVCVCGFLLPCGSSAWLWSQGAAGLLERAGSCSLLLVFGESVRRTGVWSLSVWGDPPVKPRVRGSPSPGGFDSWLRLLAGFSTFRFPASLWPSLGGFCVSRNLPVSSRLSRFPGVRHLPFEFDVTPPVFAGLSTHPSLPSSLHPSVCPLCIRPL